MLLFYKVMATVDWKKLEGRIFRFDVNTSTEEALKATNPAIIHFTTEGDIVMNGEKFCSPKKKELKVVKLYTSYEYAKYDVVLNNFGGSGELQYLDYPQDAVSEDTASGSNYVLVASLIDGKPFYWFSLPYSIGLRVASERIIGVDEKTFNAGFDSLSNDIAFVYDYEEIELKHFSYGGSTDTGELSDISLVKAAGVCYNTVVDEATGGSQFSVSFYKDLIETYSASSLLPLISGKITGTASNYFDGYVRIGKGLTTHCDKSDKGDYIDDETVGLLELLPAKADTLGGVKKANLNLQSEYEFLKAVPNVTTLDEAKFAINHLRIICKTLVDKLEEAGTLNH